MRHWILLTAIFFIAQGANARDRWGPPPACPQPKADCCPKPKCPKPCPKPKCPKPAPKPKCPPPCPPKPESCDPCCLENRCPPDMNPAYNYPAAIDICCGWNVWVDASFTYWKAMQDNMEFAISVPGDPAQIQTNGAEGASIVKQDYKYKPGFKIGVGFTSNYDNWDFYAQYIWFRSTVNRSLDAPVPGAVLPMTGNPFVNAGPDAQVLYSSASSSWQVHLDTVDARMRRCYYVGKNLLFHPYYGLRATWIRQEWKNSFTTAAPNTFSTSQDLNSWGIGPEIGLDTHWKVGYGFRIFGNAEVDLLFTQYSSLNIHDSQPVLNKTFGVKESDNNTLRTHLNMELGLAWGTYFYCNRWYFDLSAGYEFHSFFDQNMFREFDSTLGFNSVYGGNLYLHGLTIKAMLEF